jgi:serine/threonine protein kinase
MFNIVPCYGITQNPDTKDYMMVLEYCEGGDLRNYFNQSEDYDYVYKIKHLLQIARGLLDIHNAGKVHKDFHSGNILFSGMYLFISDLGMCQPANNEERSVNKEGVCGVLPYMAPEVLRGYQYTKAADIYSFGIMMNEFMSEETPYSDIPHDHILAVKICKGLRPEISEDTPKLLADLIMKCWDDKAENRPTAYELYQKLTKWSNEYSNWDGEIYSQIKKCQEIRENKIKNRPDKVKPKNIQTHPQAIYTSRLLNFKNLPEPVNSTDLSSFQLNQGNIFNLIVCFMKIINYYFFFVNRCSSINISKSK